MNTRAKVWIGVAAAGLVAVTGLASVALLRQSRLPPTDAGRLLVGPWLVTGPYHAHGENGLYRDYLLKRVEGGLRAGRGEIAAFGLAGLLRWREVDATEDGRVEFGKLWAAGPDSIAYAYTELVCDRDRLVPVTIAGGTDLQIRLRGEVVYESRVFRKADRDKDTLVLPLRAGVNPVLVKAQKGLEWKFLWTVHADIGRLFVNERETIIPDFRVSEPVDAWGQVEVANAGAAFLPDVRVEVPGDDLVVASRSEPVALAAGEVRRIPVRIATRRPVETDSQPTLQLRVAAGESEYGFEATPRLRSATTSFVTTYRSALDGSVQPYSVLLPPSFNPTKVYPLILLLHGGHVTDWGKNIISYSPKDWAIQVAPHDRGNNDYRGVGEVDIDEVLSEVQRRYRIDPERLLLSGHSMGGYGVWYLATRYPDRWAAISPQTGNTDLSLEPVALRLAGDESQQAFQRRLLQSWSPIGFAENLLHVPAYVMHGAKDKQLSVVHSRRMVARLGELGYEHVYDENPDGGHWWGSRGEHEGVLCVDKPEIAEFFKKHPRRIRNPRIVVFKTDSPRYSRAYWVRIDEMDSLDRFASIRAEVTTSSSIVVRVENTSRFSLNLSSELVATGRPVTLTVNETAFFLETLPRSVRVEFRRDSDGNWARVPHPSNTPVAAQTAGVRDHRLRLGERTREAIREGEPARKTESLCGPIIDVFNDPFLIVVGSHGGASAERMNQASRRAARSIARDWMTRCNGIAEVKSDRDVTTEDISRCNLVLIGDAETNSLLARVNSDLPIRFGNGGLMWGARSIAGADEGMVLIYPNPLNIQRYVLVVGGTTPRSLETAARLRLTGLPDYVVFDRGTLEARLTRFVAGGFFDKHWKLAE